MTGQVVRLMIPDPSCSVPIERVPLREDTETEPGSGCTIEIEASLAMQASSLVSLEGLYSVEGTAMIRRKRRNRKVFVR